MKLAIDFLRKHLTTLKAEIAYSSEMPEEMERRKKLIKSIEKLLEEVKDG